MNKDMNKDDKYMEVEHYELDDKRHDKTDKSINEKSKLFYCWALDEEKEITRAESRLFQDVIYVSNLLDKDGKEKLIKKINNYINFQAENEYKDITHEKWDLEQYLVKTPDNIQKILKAIDKENVISFRYHMYDVINKQLKVVPKRESTYRVEPYSLMWYGGNYYLVCYHSKNENEGKIINFRLDKISEVEILDEEIVHHQDVHQIDHKFKYINMFSSEIVDVRIRLKRSKINNAVDTFGEHNFKNIKLVDNDNVEFSIRNVSRLGVITWVMQFFEHCELLKPKDLREEIRDIIIKNAGKYGLDCKVNNSHE
ncbi:WYL domain-containing protein [Natranaerofaba carboxydovora]|uniref:WYL domain-containing protein n=1 Tax=Natranaerofaba carboxydovora TaxID=2742683 RepID=UPI001F131A26|nr:WYL domain-containing protein [Natranaerofaba carboxydovora]